MIPQPIKIGSKLVGPGYPAYIIAEIGSNFDNDLERAKMLAKMSKDAGADAYKIQNFLAPKIVSSEGFKDLQVAFQAKWDKPVVEVYKNAEFPREWVKEVAEYCKEIGVEFFSSPYDTDAVDLLEELGAVAYKVGSGEIDNLEFITYIAKTGKPVIIGAGAATPKEVDDAVRTVREAGNEQIILLQCVTNYPSPIKDANIRAMVAMGEEHAVLFGYSDHTIGVTGGGDDPLNGITVPVASVALGACLIEKHVTDDISRKGPDHPFAMVINGNFKDMISGVRALESALGDGVKALTPSEEETSIIQRRGAYALRDIASGEKITREDFEYLRPAVGIRPRDASLLIGATASHDIAKGKPIKADDLT